jgi:Trk K+ transport system NAD-binding subunit
MRVVIMGASKLGIMIAGILTGEGHKTVLIDINPEALNHLPPNCDSEKIVGSGTDPEVLKKIGLTQDDAFVAATTSDNINIAAIKMVKEQFHCKKTGKVIYDPLRAKAFNEVEKGIICPIFDAAMHFYTQIIAAQ